MPSVSSCPRGPRATRELSRELSGESAHERDAFGRQPIHYAIDNHHYEVIHLLCGAAERQ